MKTNQITKKLFNFFFHLVLSLMLIDWAIKLPSVYFGNYGIGIFELSFALLGGMTVIRISYEKQTFFQNVMSVLRTSKWSIYALLCYTFMGVVTLLYADSLGYALQKYIVVVQMLFFAMCFCYYVATYEKERSFAINQIFFNIGFSSIVCAMWAG